MTAFYAFYEWGKRYNANMSRIDKEAIRCARFSYTLLPEADRDGIGSSSRFPRVWRVTE